MEKLTLSEIYIYPIKSLGGISLQSSMVDKRGLRYDRRWMLIDSNGRFLTQREHPQMALMNVSIVDEGLSVRHKQNNSIPKLLIPFDSDSINNVDVQIWNDNLNALHVSPKADKWFSDVLGFRCRLVYMPDDEKRFVESNFNSGDDIVSFADGYPFLIIGQQSLDDLNSRLKEKFPMNRFRPNFVFTGGTAYTEDDWKYFKIGKITFDAIKPCSRCVLTTTNQETGERGEEPLRTLSNYRKIDNKVMFGMNLISEQTGLVNLEDELKVLSVKNPKHR